MKFRTAYDQREDEFYSSSGEMTDKLYEYRINSDGYKVLVDTGKTIPTYEHTQSFKEMCSVKAMVNRCTDLGALAADVRNYRDASELPDNFCDVVNAMLAMRSDFFRLDPQIRAKFGNDPIKYMDVVRRGDFDSFISPTAADGGSPAADEAGTAAAAAEAEKEKKE